MSNLDSNVVTIVIAVAAFASPVITTALNIWLQLHLKRMELRERSRRDAVERNRDIYERYLRSAGKCIKGNSWEDFAAYGDAFALAYAYAPSPIRSSMLKLDNALASKSLSEATDLLPEVSIQIANVLYCPYCDVGYKDKHAVYSEQQ